VSRNSPRFQDANGYEVYGVDGEVEFTKESRPSHQGGMTTTWPSPESGVAKVEEEEERRDGRRRDARTMEKWNQGRGRASLVGVKRSDWPAARDWEKVRLAGADDGGPQRIEGRG
jgi:hypothetical protein